MAFVIFLFSNFFFVFVTINHYNFVFKLVNFSKLFPILAHRDVPHRHPSQSGGVVDVVWRRRG
jgi:hypothetical protein